MPWFTSTDISPTSSKRSCQENLLIFDISFSIQYHFIIKITFVRVRFLPLSFVCEEKLNKAFGKRTYFHIDLKNSETFIVWNASASNLYKGQLALHQYFVCQLLEF